MSGNPAILITGGEGYEAGNSVEVFSLQSLSSCKLLTGLPEDVLEFISFSTLGGPVQHSQYNNLMCGVGPGNLKCWTRDTKTSEWKESHELANDRGGSCNWPVENGVIFIGGSGYGDARNTGELVLYEGGVEPWFTLEYDTK